MDFSVLDFGFFRKPRLNPEFPDHYPRRPAPNPDRKNHPASKKSGSSSLAHEGAEDHETATTQKIAVPGKIPLCVSLRDLRVSAVRLNPEIRR